MAQRDQLTFDWPHRTAQGREDFLVTACNKEAVDWIDLWPDWPGPALILSGPPGSGKTHLAAVWQARTGANAVEPAALPDIVVMNQAGTPHVLLENAGEVTDDTAFLHLFNQTVERDGTLLMTADRPVPAWRAALPDLVSRLKAVPAVEIGGPDDALIEALLVKMFIDRQLRVEQGVISYLVLRMDRSFAAARALVTQLDQAAMSQKRTITVPLAREVLRQNNFPRD